MNKPDNTLKSGFITSDTDYEDYGIKAGEKYKIDWSFNIGAYLFIDGNTIRLGNGEIRDEMWAHFTYSEK